MLRQLTVLIGKKRRLIAIDPTEIKFIEEIAPRQCNIVIAFQGKDFIYTVPHSFKHIYELTTLAEFGFMEN